MPPVAILENLGLKFPAENQPALQEINWIIEEGRHCALIGPNGSGKSTLLGLLAGNLWPTSGSISWIGPHGPETSPIFGRSITALVSPALQENAQRMGFSVTFMDALLGAFDQSPLSFASLDPDMEKLEKAREVARALNCVNLLTMPLPTLSQGQLRILLCARAILRQPRLCLLDEALDGLDKEHRDIFFAALSRLARQTTIILSSHRKDGIPPFCVERRYLFGGRLFEKPGKIFFRAAPQPKSKLPQGAGSQTLFKLENVDVFINRQQVLHNINWQSRQGEHWRISGSNGSGKSTLLRLLAGEEAAASGGSVSCWLPGIGRVSRSLDELRQGARLVSDLSQALYAYNLTGLELVCSGFEQTTGIYREYSDEEREMALQAILRFFPDGERMAKASIRQLSSGQLRRLHLARALMGKPSILLLDEPCTGLDAQSRAGFFALLESLSRTMQIIMVSHYDEDCPPFINREAVMSDGRLAIIR